MRYMKYVGMSLIGICVASAILLFCGKLKTTPPEELVVPLSIDGSANLVFYTDNKAAQNLTITNKSSTITALNVSADLGSTLRDVGVTQTPATECANLAPGASCVISFAANGHAIGQTSFKIYGENTSKVDGAISVVDPNDEHPHLSAKPNTVEFANINSAPELEIRNEGTKNVPATNISIINFSDLAQTIQDHVEVSYLHCGSVGPGADCAINFTFKDRQDGLPYATGTLKIKGDNTDTISVNITLNGAKIEVTSGNSNLVFAVGNTKSQSMTIKNASNEDNVAADGIMAHLDTLSDKIDVDASATTCGGKIDLNATCIISFKLKDGVTEPFPQTEFKIFGNNTGTLNPAPTIKIAEKPAILSFKGQSPDLAFDNDHQTLTIIIYNESDFDATNVSITTNESNVPPGTLFKILDSDGKDMTSTFNIPANGNITLIFTPKDTQFLWLPKLRFSIQGGNTAQLTGSFTIGKVENVNISEASFVLINAASVAGYNKTATLTVQNVSQYTDPKSFGARKKSDYNQLAPVLIASSCSLTPNTLSCNLTFTGNGKMDESKTTITGKFFADDNALVDVDMNVLDYGSVYKNGYIFAFSYNGTEAGATIASLEDAQDSSSYLLNLSRAESACERIGFRVPTFCELGYDGQPTGYIVDCSGKASTQIEKSGCDGTMPNMFKNLFQKDVSHFEDPMYWSVTKVKGYEGYFWTMSFHNSNLGSEQATRADCDDYSRARCVQDITIP